MKIGRFEITLRKRTPPTAREIRRQRWAHVDTLRRLAIFKYRIARLFLSHEKAEEQGRSFLVGCMRGYTYMWIAWDEIIKKDGWTNRDDWLKMNAYWIDGDTEPRTP